ncbi:MAG: Flp pilus assembly protein CpaB [Hyphomicrobiales bacterium]|nr:Flp pilus assembly protein CpaB [Hyphomicrobiales bacterium]
MKNKPIIMIAIAVIFGAMSIFVADVWLDASSNARPVAQKVVKIEAPAIKYATIVAAAKPLRYGDKITAEDLVEIPWPEDKLPAGAYKNINQAVSDGERLVLTPIEVNELLLLSKLSGKDGRAALSNKLSSGMRAVTIPVDDVSGVAGFITPGDRVDIVLIRSGETMSADVILQNVKVITVDQAADERNTSAKVANAITLEVTSEEAKKLALAKATGKLSLTLRAAGDQVLSADASENGILDRLTSMLESDNVPKHRTVIVTRALAPTPYSVVNEEYVTKQAGLASDKQIQSGLQKQ